MRFCLNTIFLGAIIFLASSDCLEAEDMKELTIPAVEKMPRMPQPYKMRNWKKVARDFDKIAFDPNAKGEYLPLLQWDDRKLNSVNRRSFIIPSYVGPNDPMQGESISVMGCVLGSTFAGVDKSKGDFDFVRALEVWFARDNGMNMIMNNYNQVTGQTAWYELFPGLIFNAIVYHYQDTPGFDAIIKQNADRWYEAAYGCVNKKGEPDFYYTSYNHATGKPVYNGTWREPDMAPAIATIEYWAYQKTGDKKYLKAAKRCMDWYNKQEGNFGYEVLYTFAPYVAARLNAEEGTNYNVRNLVNGCFRELDTRPLSVILGGDKYDGIDLSGLAAFGYHKKNGGYAFYAFGMNTFELAWPLVPVARYDKRLARAIAIWMLNAANAARLFYPNAHPPERQTCPDWKGDPNNCLAYEGIRHNYDDYDAKHPSQPLLASGDPVKHKWPFKTDFGIYSSMFAGVYGGIIKKTEVPGILQLDLLKTDAWRKKAYPTFLYYNPYKTPKKITINVGGKPVDIYEMKQEKFIARKVKNKVKVTLQPDKACILVLTPAGGKLTKDKKGRTYVNGVVVDFGYSKSPTRLHGAVKPKKYAKRRLYPTPDWKISSSYKLQPNLMVLALDRNADTAFDSGGKQKPGDWIQLDLGEPYDLEAVHVNPGRNWWNLPDELLVEYITGDGQWKKAGQAPRAQVRLLTIDLNAPKATAIRFKLVKASTHWWSVAEIELYGKKAK